MDHPRADVDAARGEPQGAPTSLLLPRVLAQLSLLTSLSLLVFHEVGADHHVVLAAQGATAGAVGGGALRARDGAVPPAPPGSHLDHRQSVSPSARKKQSQQRLDEPADTVLHVVDFLSWLMTTPPDRSLGRGGIAVCSELVTA
ncbi:hypothetical protein ACFU96_22295 [Streptomyces sp. NPDC057620]|uniref:hypothetical protein n=1 Tax=Streptomyces sp. NPDC057620 TaxID=3346185 RepID=UPI003699CCE1